MKSWKSETRAGRESGLSNPVFLGGDLTQMDTAWPGLPRSSPPSHFPVGLGRASRAQASRSCPAPWGAVPEGQPQIPSPNRVTLPPRSCFRSTQPASPLGATDSFLSLLSKSVRPGDCHSRRREKSFLDCQPFDGEFAWQIIGSRGFLRPRKGGRCPRSSAEQSFWAPALAGDDPGKDGAGRQAQGGPRGRGDLLPSAVRLQEEGLMTGLKQDLWPPCSPPPLPRGPLLGSSASVKPGTLDDICPSRAPSFPGEPAHYRNPERGEASTQVTRVPPLPSDR